MTPIHRAMGEVLGVFDGSRPLAFAMDGRPSQFQGRIAQSGPPAGEPEPEPARGAIWVSDNRLQRLQPCEQAICR